MDEKDDLMARTMVENLSIGINPLTGRALPPSDCCANEVVQEALKAVLEHCSLESYGIIIGTDTDVDYAYMDEYGIAKTTPEDLRGELSENAKAIANMLISMGLAKRFADGVTLIGWEV